jgi:hypothetical protein
LVVPEFPISLVFLDDRPRILIRSNTTAYWIWDLTSADRVHGDLDQLAKSLTGNPAR